MKTVPASASDEELLALVEQWVSFLAAADWASASAMLFHGSSETEWSPAAIAAWVTNYGTDEPIPGEPPAAVTEPSAARTAEDYPRPQKNVDRQHLGPLDPKQYAGWIRYDLPIDGFWSDLTARFKIKKTEGSIALELDMIEVM